MAETDQSAIACADSLAALVKLGAYLDDALWSARTECPAWTVGDIYAHVVGVEQWLAEGAPAFTEPTQEFIDSHVTARRGRARQEVLHELGALLSIRRDQLTDLPELIFAPFLRRLVPAELALSLRAFDLYTHEQDVRRAIGRPGHLGGHGGEVVRNLLLLSLPKAVAKGAGAPAASTFRITALGEASFDAAVHVDGAGRGSLTWPWQPGHATTTHVTLSWEAFARLGAGRGARTDHEILITGDPDLAERVLSHLNVAP